MKEKIKDFLTAVLGTIVLVIVSAFFIRFTIMAIEQFTVGERLIGGIEIAISIAILTASMIAVLPKN